MQNTISIDGNYASRYDVATYTQFQQEMYRMITQSSINLQTAFRITTSDLENWNEQIQTLVDVNKVIRATVNTEKLAELDTLRDKAIARLFALIKLGLDSFTASEVEAAKRLDLIRKKYNGIQKLNYDRQTASVEGLLMDLGTPEATADLRKITGLTDLVKRITQANNEFRTLYGQTSDTRATSQLPSFAQMKATLSPLWQQITKHIEAGYIFAQSGSDRKAIESLVDLLNQRIKQIREAWNRSQGISGNSTKKDKKPSEDLTSPNTWADGTSKADGE